MKELEYPFDSGYLLKKKRSIKRQLLSDGSVRIKKKIAVLVICTPKVRHIWRCIFLWAKQEEKTKRTRQNSKSML